MELPSLPPRTRPRLQLPPLVSNATRQPQHETMPQAELLPSDQDQIILQHGTMPQTNLPPPVDHDQMMLQDERMAPPSDQDQMMLQGGAMPQGIFSTTALNQIRRHYRLMFVPVPSQQTNAISCEQQQQQQHQSTSKAYLAGIQGPQHGATAQVQWPNGNVPIRPRPPDKIFEQQSTSSASFIGNQGPQQGATAQAQLSNANVPKPSNKSCHRQQQRQSKSKAYFVGNPAPPVVTQQQQLRCWMCSATQQDVKGIRISTTGLLFNGNPHCYRCYKFVWGQKEEIKANKYNNYTSCACANSGKSGQELHDMCRQNPKERAGFMNIGCTICKLRLCEWVGFDITKIDTYATEEKWWAANSMSKLFNQVDELKSKSSRAICRQISAVNELIRSIAILRVNSGVDIDRLMSVNFKLNEFIVLSAKIFMQALQRKGIAMDYLIGEGVRTDPEKPELADQEQWMVLSCHVEQQEEGGALVYLQMPLKGDQINPNNEQIVPKLCKNGDEITEHLVKLENKNCVADYLEGKGKNEEEVKTTTTKSQKKKQPKTLLKRLFNLGNKNCDAGNNSSEKQKQHKPVISYFNGAFRMTGISVDTLRAVLGYLRKCESIPHKNGYCNTNFANDIFVCDQVGTVDDYVTPRAASLVLYKCGQINDSIDTELLEELFNGFCCPLVVIEAMDGFKTFDFWKIQQCKQFKAANVVVFRKNHRDASAPNAPKIDADAYVAYVNNPWKFSSFVWSEKLSRLWLERSNAEHSHRDLSSSVIQYLPTITAAEEKVCNLLANLVLTDAFLEDLFLGPGRMHFIDIELLSGLMERKPKTIFSDLVDKLKQIYKGAEK